MHHSDAGWTCARRFEELLDIDEDGLSAVAEFVPRFGMVLHDISHASDDELMSRAMTTFARITLLLFRHGRKPKDPQEIFERLGKYVAALHELLAAPNGARAFVAILRYLESITPRSRGEVVKALQKTMRISEEQYDDLLTGLLGPRKNHDNIPRA